MKVATARHYQFSADVLRTIAIVSVVSIHVTHAVYARPDFLGGLSWLFADMWNAFSRPAVPIFLMLSGYLLIPKEESLQATYQRLLRRLLVPFLFWFLFDNMWNGGHPSLHFLYFPQLLHDIFFSGFQYFLRIVIGLYLCLPLFRKYLPRFSQFQQIAICVFFFVLGIALTLLGYLTHNFIFSWSPFIWIPYIGYFLAGFVLGKLKITPRVQKILAIIFFTSVLFTAFLGYKSLSLLQQGNQFIYPNGALSPYFDHYLAPNIVIMTVCLFLLLIHAKLLKLSTSQWLTKSIQSVAKNSFGIYLIHESIIDVVNVYLHLGVDFVRFPLWAYLVLLFAFVFSLAYMIANVWRHLPFVSAFIGGK